MASRYELHEGPWRRIVNLLPGRKETVGRTVADNRMFVNGVLCVLRSGARWSDWPERYGKYKSVPKRLARWAASGVWEQSFRTLTQDAKNEYLRLDSTMDWTGCDLVEQVPGKAGGRPVIRGTRIEPNVILVDEEYGPTPEETYGSFPTIAGGIDAIQKIRAFARSKKLTPQ